MERHFAALGWDGLLLGSRRGLGWGLVWVLGLGLELRDWDIPVSSVRCTVKMAIKSARLFNKCWQHSEPQRNAPSFMISWRKWNMILWIARSDSWDSFFSLLHLFHHLDAVQLSGGVGAGDGVGVGGTWTPFYLVVVETCCRRCCVLWVCGLSC